MRDKYVFSNGQDLGSLDSTGVVSEHVFDMELDALSGNTIIENDQVEGWFCFKILTTTNTGGNDGLDIELRESDAAAMTTPRYLGTIKLLQAELVAGAVYAIKVQKQLALKFLGAWFKAINTSLNGVTTVDCFIHTGPLSPNDSIQKVPGR